MKKVLLVATLLIASMSFAQTTAIADTGIFQFETETINYGAIEQNANGNRIFKFKNIGTAPIIITNIKGSCGCTVATKPTKPILPNETAEIGVSYATNRIGGFSKSLTITSNAQNSKKMLKIKGQVLKPESVALNQ